MLDVAKRAKLPKHALISLAEADCFQSTLQDRREILWAVRRIPDDEDLPLFASQYVEEQPQENIAPLPSMPLSEHVLADYQALRLSLRAHLMFFERRRIHMHLLAKFLRQQRLIQAARAAAAQILAHDRKHAEHRKALQRQQHTCA